MLGCRGEGVTGREGDKVTSSLASFFPSPCPLVSLSPCHHHALLRRIIINKTHYLVGAVAVFGQGLGDGAAGPAGTDDEDTATEEGLGQGQDVEGSTHQEEEQGEEEEGEKGQAAGGEGRSEIGDEQVDEDGEQAGLEDGGSSSGEAAGHAQVVGVEGVGQEQPQAAEEQEPVGAPGEQLPVEPVFRRQGRPRGVSVPQGEGQEEGAVEGQQVQEREEDAAFGDVEGEEALQSGGLQVEGCRL